MSEGGIIVPRKTETTPKPVYDGYAIMLKEEIKYLESRVKYWNGVFEESIDQPDMDCADMNKHISKGLMERLNKAIGSLKGA